MVDVIAFIAVCLTELENFTRIKNQQRIFRATQIDERRIVLFVYTFNSNGRRSEISIFFIVAHKRHIILKPPHRDTYDLMQVSSMFISSHI